MSSSPFDVSIVIPTYNGIDGLPALLAAIRGQQTALSFEIIAVDSGSTDGTIEFLREHVDRLLTVQPGRFDHGLTRNQAIAAGSGDLVVLLVQDANPFDEHWLQAMTTPLLDDDKLAATWCRQIPREEASALTRHYLGTWSGTSKETARVFISNPATFDTLPPIERLQICTFDNVCSCLRRVAWQQFPFRSTPIAEDLEWAKEVLLAGYGICYTAESAVVHSHERSPWYELHRTIQVHRRLRELFDVQTIPSIRALLQAIATTLPLHLRCLTQEVGSLGTRMARLPRYLGLAITWPLGQYLGGSRSSK